MDIEIKNKTQNHVSWKIPKRIVGGISIVILLLALYGTHLFGQVWKNIGMITLTRALVTTSNGTTSKEVVKAETFLRQAVTYATKDRSAWQGLGLALAIQGREEEAMAAWQTAGQMFERFIMWGNQTRLAGQYEKALDWYNRAIKLEPASDNRDIWDGLGQTYVSREEWSLALQAFQKGLQAHTGQVGQSILYYRIGRIRQFSSSPPDFEGAWVAYEQALALNDFSTANWLKAETYYLRGNILYSQQRWEEATREYLQALAISSQHYWAHLSLASALWKLDRNDEAKDFVQKAIELEPDRREAYRRLGHFYRTEGNTIQARAMYSKVLELNPEDKQAENALDALNEQ